MLGEGFFTAIIIMHLAPCNQTSGIMRKKYLFLGLAFAFFAILNQAIAGEPDKDAASLRNVDIKYDFEINAYLLEFPDFANYKAILFKSETTWEYKLFYKDNMIEAKDNESVENLTEDGKEQTKDAIGNIFIDIQAHEKLLKAISKQVHN